MKIFLNLFIYLWEKLITVKLIIILILFLMLFHVLFLSSKKYNISKQTVSCQNLTEDQYYMYLTMLVYEPEDLEQILINTHTTYFFKIKKEFNDYIKIGYFVLLSLLILKLNIKRERKNIDNFDNNKNRIITAITVLLVLFFNILLLRYEDNTKYKRIKDFNQSMKAKEINYKIHSLEEEKTNIRGELYDLESRIEDISDRLYY